jgi:hypothetical protein
VALFVGYFFFTYFVMPLIKLIRIGLYLTIKI